jgi:hypothetical protein
MIKRYDHAELLYRILPSIYRERDASGDLRNYLNGCGVLLDQLHSTLQQRYADIFPDSDSAFELDSQAWLLPYIAALLDVRLTSPLESGKRSEIANAISWRKAKGTLRVVDEVAEAVGGVEMVVHEGWKRVATTARVGMPLLELSNYGYPGEAPAPQHAALRARHPGLPAGTVDLRCQGSAVKAAKNNPAAQISHVDGKRYRWRQSSLHGAQNCNAGHSVLPFNALQADWIPGYFDDPSVRIVDFRNPNWRQGQFHPRRVLLFTPTHAGFFAATEHRFLWSETLQQEAAFRAVVSVEVQGERTLFRNRSLDDGPFVPVVIRLRVKLEQVPSGTGPVDPPVWRFEGIVFSHTVEVDSGRLEFERCAVLAAEVHSTDLEGPVLTADDCLFKRVQAAKGLVRLQYCTVLTTTIAESLQASDCIFNGLIRKDHDPASLPGEGCVRYSTLLPEQPCGALTFYNQRKLRPVFFSVTFGQPGCGVLHPASPAEIGHGAEDGGEMGAYHHLYLVASREAVITKLKDFLPTGIRPVVIPDHSLHQLPGEFTDAESE